MTNKQLLLALGGLDDATVAAAHEPKLRGTRRPLQTALIAAAVAVLCLTVAWAGVNSYRARFASSKEEWWEKFPATENCRSFYYGMDTLPACSADDETASHVETARDLIRRSGECDRTSGSFYRRTEDGRMEDTGAGYDWDLVRRAYEMPSLSAMRQFQNDYHPDVRYLESTLEGVEGSFLYVTERGDGRIWGAGQEDDPVLFTDQMFELQARGCYRTPSGGSFELMFDYYPILRWGPSWFVGETITLRDTVQSADGTTFDMAQAGDWIIADAIFQHGYVSIVSVGATVEEVTDQITHLDLGDVPAVFSVGAER